MSYITYLSGLRTGNSVFLKGKEAKLGSNWSEFWKTKTQAFFPNEVKETIDLGNGYSVSVLVLRVNKGNAQPIDVARQMAKDIMRAANDGSSAAVVLRSLGIASVIVSEKVPNIEELAASIDLCVLKEGAELPTDFNTMSVSSLVSGQEGVGSTGVVCDASLVDVAVGIYTLIDNTVVDTDEYDCFEQVETSGNDLDLDDDDTDTDFDEEGTDQNEEVVEVEEEDNEEDNEDEDDDNEEDNSEYTEVHDEEYEEDEDGTVIGADDITLIQVKREPRLIFLMHSSPNISEAELGELADYKGFDLALPLRKALKKKQLNEGYLRAPLNSVLSVIAGLGRDIQVLSSQYHVVVSQIDDALRNTVNQLLDYALYQQNQLLDDDQDPSVNGIVFGDFTESESEDDSAGKAEMPLVDFVSGGVFFTDNYANVVIRCVFPALFFGTTPAKQTRLLHTVHSMIQNTAAEHGVKALVGVNYLSTDLLPTAEVELDMLLPVAGEESPAVGVATFNAWGYVNGIDGVGASPEGYETAAVSDLGSDDDNAMSLIFGDEGFDMVSFVVNVQQVEEEE